MIVKEQMQALQENLRQAVHHRHAEVANAVKIAQAQQNLGEEDWRTAQKRLDAYINDGLDRLSRVTDEVESKLTSNMADVRGRLAAVEASLLTGNSRAQG